MVQWIPSASSSARFALAGLHNAGTARPDIALLLNLASTHTTHVSARHGECLFTCSRPVSSRLVSNLIDHGLRSLLPTNSSFCWVTASPRTLFPRNAALRSALPSKLVSPPHSTLLLPSLWFARTHARPCHVINALREAVHSSPRPTQRLQADHHHPHQHTYGDSMLSTEASGSVSCAHPTPAVDMGADVIKRLQHSTSSPDPTGYRALSRPGQDPFHGIRTMPMPHIIPSHN